MKKPVLWITILSIALSSLLCGCGAKEPAPDRDEPSKETSSDIREPDSVQAIAPEDAPELTAKKAFVYDCSTGQYLYLLGEETDWVYPASTTKLFCGWVALQYLQPQQLIKVGEELGFLEDLASTAGLWGGDVMTTEMMVRAMLVPSGCDASYTLAVNAGRIIAKDNSLTARQAVDVFVEEMNRQAELHGMVNTHFVTPDGYHRDDHKISLQAYVKIGQLCMAEPTIMNVVKDYRAPIVYTDLNGIPRSRELQNYNEIINPDSKYYRETCIGLKTGNTSVAGGCMLAAFQLEDRQLLIGVFGCASQTDRYVDATKLYDACVIAE